MSTSNAIYTVGESTLQSTTGFTNSEWEQPTTNKTYRFFDNVVDYGEGYKFTEWYPHRLGRSSLNGSCQPFLSNAQPNGVFANSRSVNGRTLPTCDEVGSLSSVYHISSNEELSSNDRSVTIESLPDLVLLQIFQYCHPIKRIHILSHVCKRWNALIYSPWIWTEVRIILVEQPNNTNACVNFIRTVGKCLRKLCIKCNRVEVASGFARLFPYQLSQLTVLDIGTIPEMTVDSMRCITKNLPNLESLNMEDISMVEPMVSEVLFSATAFPRLKCLMIAHFPFNEQSFRQLIRWERPLEVLSIDGVKPFEVSERLDLGTAYFAMSLRRFYVHGFLELAPSDERVFKFSSVCAFRNLTLFSISFCPCADDRQFIAIKALTQLQHLHITGYCSWASTEVLMALFSGSPPGFPSKLKFLCISHFYSLTDGVIDAITLNCPKLQSLNVSRCDRLTDEGFSMIIGRLSELRFLDVSVNAAFTKRSMQAIVHSSLPYLRYLIIHKCSNVERDDLRKLSMRMKNLWISSALDTLLRSGFCLDERLGPGHVQYLYAILNELSQIQGYCCVTDITRPFL